MGVVDEILKKLSIEEKIKLTFGKSYWETNEVSNIKSKIITDGPHGVRLQNHDLEKMFIEDSYKSFSYPSLSTLANSFDEKVVYSVAKEIGLEANKLNVSMVLGPGVNIKRHPRGGRNFEYFSEDPILSGRLGYQYVKGLESTGVGACLKHLACNNQEYNRFLSNSIVDSRTFHELYLKPFTIALKAKPSAIMTSYNRVNNVYSSDNKKLLNELRKDYKYKGFFISDWGGRNDLAKSIKSSLSLEMPGVDKTRNNYLLDLYNEGLIKESDLDKALKPLIKFLIREKKHTTFDINKVYKVALDANLKSMVLLKNEDNILPLSKKDKILVLGKFFKCPRFQGSGSSKVNPSILVTPNEAFINNNIKFDYIESFDDLGNLTNYKEALISAKNYKKILIFLSLPDSFESEGYDRENLNLPKPYLDFLEELSKINNNIVVVLGAGSQVDFSFSDKVKGILFAYLGGSTMGEAIYRLLYNKANPSAKLAESIASEELTYLNNNYPVKDINNYYKEGLYVGYPYYYLKDIKLKYPFGYGLSYSKFSYRVSELDNKINVEIHNSGESGIDTLFLFVEDSKRYIRLKDFKKIKVLKNSKSNISFEIIDEYFNQYVEKYKKEVKGSGKFKIHIATSINNFIYTKEIDVVGICDYVHPELNLNLTKGKAKKSKEKSLISTLEDFKGTKYFDYLNNLINQGTPLDEIKDYMTRHERLVAYTSTPLRFYTIYTDLNFTIYELLSIINGVNGNESLEKLYLNKKNYTLLKDINKNS